MGTTTQIVLGVGVIVTSVVLFHYGKRFYCKSKKKVTLKDSQAKYPITLISKKEVSHDTKKFRFELPNKDENLGLPIGQHVHLSAKIGDDLVIRSYTPISTDDEVGFVEFIVKVYYKGVHPKFPDGGKMTQHLDSLKIGDTIDIRGPSGRMVYNGNGEFMIKKLRKDPPHPVKVNKVAMIAGGTGITPMLQLIRYMTDNPKDKTQMCLLFANQTEKDILVRKELEDVAKKYPDRLKIWYTLDTPPEGWKYSSGFVNSEMIKAHLFPPSDDTLVVMCGPPPMVNYACIPSLDALGYNKDLVFAY